MEKSQQTKKEVKIENDANDNDELFNRAAIEMREKWVKCEYVSIEMNIK